MIKRFIAPLMAAIFLAGTFGMLAGCNTLEGAGQDLQQGGRALSDEAREQRR